MKNSFFENVMYQLLKQRALYVKNVRLIAYARQSK